MTLNADTIEKSHDLPSDESLINGFIEDCRLRGLSTQTTRSYKSNLGIVSKFLRGRNLSLLDLDRNALKTILQYFMGKREYTHKTLENHFSALSSLYQYLNYEGIQEANPILPFRKRYLKRYKNSKNQRPSERKLISVEEMAMLISSILNPRDKAIITLLAKTGIRRGELVDIDLDDIDWIEQSIKLKQKPKRSNRVVFFDDECAHILHRWFQARKNYNVKPGCNALFVNIRGDRLKRHGVRYAVTRHAEKVGLHHPDSERMEDHFSPHCCRHWFTTHLRRNGLNREFLKELRGDSRREAVDIYDHIDHKELRRAYLAAIPRLGIT